MFTFRPSSIPSNIFVVGCGGTGSRLVPALIQFIRSITKEHVPSGWLGTTNIVLVDGDVVEQKNLIRQNFVQSDVGKNKALVLANRYGKAYGMNVVPYMKYIEEGTNPQNFRSLLNEATGLNLTNNYNDMVIMCVDSAKARRIVIQALQGVYGENTVFIDAGNEDSFGQVRMFHNAVLVDHRFQNEEVARKKYKNPERIEFVPEPLNFIPFDFHFYRDLEDNPGLGSCADLDQTLAINSLMAMYILSFVQNHYYNKVIDYNAVSIDIVKGSTAYTKNTVVEYRNKMIHSGTTIRSIGVDDGMLLHVQQSAGDDDLLGQFLHQNTEAVNALLAAQTVGAPVVEEVKAAAPKKKTKVKELRPVIQVEPMNVEISTITFNAEPLVGEASGPALVDFEAEANNDTFALPESVPPATGSVWDNVDQF
jgi:molybdopterin/thiamine biosynthesis adenylyltransferase